MFSSRVSPDSYHSTLSLGDNHVLVFSSRVTPDSYHSILSLGDNHVLVFSSRVTPDSYHSTLSLGDNHVLVFSSRVTPDSYHSTLSLGDNHVRTKVFVFNCGQPFDVYKLGRLRRLILYGQPSDMYHMDNPPMYINWAGSDD